MLKLLFGLILLFVVGCEPQRAIPEFHTGDRVKLVADPRYNNGIIYRVWCGVKLCIYDVRFGLYSSEGMISSELVLLP